MIQQSDPVQTACINDMKDVLTRYGKKLSIEELIAITAQLTGNLFGLRHIAQPDAEVQETMDICIKNIDLGCAVAMESVATTMPGEEGTA